MPLLLAMSGSDGEIDRHKGLSFSVATAAEKMKNNDARVVKLVDTRDLKSLGF